MTLWEVHWTWGKCGTCRDECQAVRLLSESLPSGVCRARRLGLGVWTLIRQRAEMANQLAKRAIAEEVGAGLHVMIDRALEVGAIARMKPGCNGGYTADANPAHGPGSHSGYQVPHGFHGVFRGG